MRQSNVQVESRRLAARNAVLHDLQNCMEERRRSSRRTDARLLQHHKKLIHANVQGKRRYATLRILEQYLQTYARGGAQQALQTADRTLVRRQMGGLVDV